MTHIRRIILDAYRAADAYTMKKNKLVSSEEFWLRKLGLLILAKYCREYWKSKGL